VVGGNVLTSQRVTDVVLKAFQACAASQGDCNNLTFGFGGNAKIDSNGNSDKKNSDASGPVKGFGYYETIAGGSGAGPTWDGTSGVHTHMTNTRITDAEVFERRYPVILREFSLRNGTGGKGQHSGGDGVVRDIEFRIPVQVSILSERRVYHPYGLEGGEDAECGVNIWVRRIEGGDKRSDDRSEDNTGKSAGDRRASTSLDIRSGQLLEAEPLEPMNTNKADSQAPNGETKDWGTDEAEYRYINMGGKNTAAMKKGERIIVMTPGGGGWGKEGADRNIQGKLDPKHWWRQGSVATRQAEAEASA
jgi:5-oxoprolinase (ATP-hydrolysing)